MATAATGICNSITSSGHDVQVDHLVAGGLQGQLGFEVQQFSSWNRLCQSNRFTFTLNVDCDIPNMPTNKMLTKKYCFLYVI